QHQCLAEHFGNLHLDNSFHPCERYEWFRELVSSDHEVTLADPHQGFRAHALTMSGPLMTASFAIASLRSRAATVSISISSAVASPEQITSDSMLRSVASRYSYPSQSGPPPTLESSCICGSGRPAWMNTDRRSYPCAWLRPACVAAARVQADRRAISSSGGCDCTDTGVTLHSWKRAMPPDSSRSASIRTVAAGSA